MKKVGWAIVGLGAQAEKIAQAMKNTKIVQLNAVCDSRVMRVKDFTANYKAGAYFNSFDEMLKQAEIDAVFVSSPNYLHARQSLAALKIGKHVLCEKPLIITLKETQAIKDIILNSKTIFGVGYHLRFHPVFLEAKKIMEGGQLGDIRLIEVHWSVGKAGEIDFPPLKDFQRWREDPKLSGGGALMARGVHLFDLLLFLLGQPAQEVCSWSDSRESGQNDKLTGGMISFGGIKAVIATGRQIPFAQNRVIIYGSNGCLSLPNPFDPEGRGQLEIVINGKTFVKRFTKKIDLYQREIEDFSRAVLTGKNWSGTALDDGIENATMVEAWISSIKNKKVIKIE